MVARLVIAGVASGAGKTTTTVALARAFAARGLRVALFKCGPDYLDPTYHARATGRPSHNLDGWMMGRDAVLSTFASAARDADVALVEGVMGLFDGASARGEEGSTAQIAKWLGAPVVAVVDASGMARTIAAVAHGLATFDPELTLAGIVCNRVGGRGHLDILREASRTTPVLGALPDDPALAFPERHLGLHTADERVVPDALLERWGQVAQEWIALDRVLELARAAGPLPLGSGPQSLGGGPQRLGEAPVGTGVSPTAAPLAAPLAAPPRCRIGLAQDEAFHFYYDDNLRRLEAYGAELVAFSPIRDPSLPPVDGVLLGGGYPELHAEALAANESMRASLRAFAARGGPVYAECGGLMYLARVIRTLDGVAHAMVGLVDGEVVMRSKLQALGYVEVETQRATPIGPAGLRFRGHQFRYSELVLGRDPAPAAYSIRRRHDGEATREANEGVATGNVLASYVHAHWASNPLPARNFVDACVAFRSRTHAEAGRHNTPTVPTSAPVAASYTSTDDVRIT